MMFCTWGLLTACGTLFDSPPPPEGADPELSSQILSNLTAMGDASAAASGRLKEVGSAAVARDPGAVTKAADQWATIDFNDSVMDVARRNAAGAVVQPGSTTSKEKPEGPKKPSLSFERRVLVDMPQLAVLGMDKATLWVDDEKIVLGGMTKAGRIGLVAPGHHLLKVECPFDPLFSADFYLEKGDRMTLSGDCSATQAAADAASAGNLPLDTNARKRPTLSFDQVGVDASQLVIQGMGNATILVDDKKLESEGWGLDHVLTVQPGHHDLKVLFPASPPFVVDFVIEVGERATLRGN